MKSFLIIGMGTFGHLLCHCLAEHECEIMIADLNPENIEDCLNDVVSAKIGDCTNPDVLSSFGVESFDTCFVCIGTDFQNSLEITSLLKELGAKKVISKAENDIHEKFLLRNGADEVIYPEKNVAKRLAFCESSIGVFDTIELSADYSIFEIQPQKAWLGKSIKELNFRARYNITILAVKKNGIVSPLPPADYIFKPEEHIMILAKVDEIYKLTKY